MNTCVAPSANQTILPTIRPALRIRLDRAGTVRAGATVAVVIYHAFALTVGTSWQSPAGAERAEAIKHAIVMALPAFEQLLAVFFLMAGYFAHRAFQRSRLPATRRTPRTFLKFFLWRRFWRLAPPFWVALLFSYFVSFDHPWTWDGLRKLTVNASMLKTLYPGYFFSINHSHWYVAAQWQLDLLFPVFLLLLVRSSARFAAIVAWSAALIVTFVVPQFTDAAYWCYLPVRWWAEWSLGVYLADRHLAGFRVFPAPTLIAVGSGIALVLGAAGGIYWVEWLAVRVFVAVVFESLLLSRSPRAGWEKLLGPLVGCSYSLYLFHVPIQQLVKHAMLAVGVTFSSFTAWIGFTVVSFALAFLVARVSAEVIERKSCALGNRLWRRRFVMRLWARAWWTHLREFGRFPAKPKRVSVPV